MATEIQSGSSILRPRARLIKTIGEELISSDVVAAMELVKNSYDADASIIVIKFQGEIEKIQIEKKQWKNVLKKSGASITISDDGKGMSLQTIQDAWMEPATIMKKKEKVSPGKSRRYTGEKGIGRFASAKLSTELQIVTREAGDNEVVVNFNWNDFSNDNLYLDEVSTSWEVRKPTDIKTHGTQLTLTNLNADWDEEKIRNLRIALSRIINPIAPVEDFLIELNVPEELGDSGLIEPPDTINRPDYRITGSVDGNGNATIYYSSRKEAEPIKINKKIDRTDNKKEPFESGPFDFEFRVWNREKEALERLAGEIESTIRNVKADLDQLNGVSIYRDNFRVLPYGDPKFDWLRLNARRVNNPTLRISDNQVIGYVSISLDRNPLLKDQSNREGIVSSKAFEDLRDQVIAVITELEERRYEERPRKEADDAEPEENLYSSFSITPIADAVASKLPNDKDVMELVKNTQEKIDKGVRKVQDVLARYRRLSTLGLLIDSILHDGGQFLLTLDGEIRLLEKELHKTDVNMGEVLKHLKAIQDQRKVMGQLFKRIEPFGGRKRGRPSKIIIEDSIRNVFELKRSDLKNMAIDIELPESQNTVTIDDSELQMIIINLLHNSIYWLGKVEKNRKIVVQVERFDDRLSVVFSDSGPGVPEEKAKFIFDPYYTTREDGVGLGLTIIGELVAEYNGDFFLINNGPLDGATFQIDFRRRI